MMAEILYGIGLVIIFILSIFWHLLQTLPPPVQGCLLAIIFSLFIYNKGWNDAVSLIHHETIDKADDDYQRRRR